ncbi:phage protein [Yersinia intermedia]|nr:phage protein [Yersinia intermedia]
MLVSPLPSGRLYQPEEYSVMANSDTQMKRPYPPLSFVNEFTPHIELVPAAEVLKMEYAD